MSQFYDLASLVVIPSGYKASTIYAQKPLTTNGQLSFTRASTATRVNSSGLIAAVASNVPRLDYLGSTCPRLQLEGQRTNLATYSEEIDNAAWTKTRSTITANTSVSPDGTVDAERITDTTFTANSSFVERQITSVIGTAYTFSSFLKAGTAPFMYVGIYDGTNFNAILNAATGAISFTTAGATSTVTAYGNGWYRVSITRTITASASVYPYIGVCQLSNSITYNGTGAYTAQIWGVQYEAGAYATSYIPTLSASVTRVADAASKTGISSLIGQTEGTIFAEIYPEEFVNGSYISISDGANSANRIIFGFEVGSVNSGTLLVFGATGLTGSGTYNRGQKVKVAIGYKSGSSVLYVNGNLVNTSTSTFTVTLTRFGFDSLSGSQPFVGRCSQALLFKTRLTNAQLAELTTL